MHGKHWIGENRILAELSLSFHVSRKVTEEMLNLNRDFHKVNKSVRSLKAKETYHRLSLKP